MKFGYFDDQKKEYVINTPLTPNPWINYLGNHGYFSLISNTGGGYTFYQDAKLRRITRYRYNNVPTDFGGKYYYINNGKEVWNPGFLPTKTALDDYSCRHGMGYSVIRGKKDDLEAEITYFIPQDDPVEIHVLKLTNQSNKEKAFKVFGMVEWALWDAVEDQRNFQRNLNVAEVEVTESTIYHKSEYRERRNHYAFYHSQHKTHGFDTDRQVFLGAYNGWHEPEVVMQGQSKQSVVQGRSPIASHQIDVVLQPGASETLIFLLGYAENDINHKFVDKNVINKEVAKALVEKYKHIDQINQAFNELKMFWDQTLSIYQVNSTETRLNRMVNIWHQYQCMTTFNMSRSASYYESGTGRGIGFRDSCQDILGFVHMVPERSRERILDLAAVQFEDGSTYHQYQPLTKKGNADIGSGFNDDPLWLIAATSAYIKETGDFSILDEMVPFDNDETRKKTMFEHLEASIDYTLNHLGPHGLPLIGHADWNDCLNLNCFSTDPSESFQTTVNKMSGVAESVFIAGMFVLYGEAFSDIAMRIGKTKKAKHVYQAVDQMKENIIKHGWDGAWYLRAYDSFGHKVGSHENEEGKIFVESQGICSMAQIGAGLSYDEQALASVDKYLKNDYGVELVYPTFKSYHIELGEISSYPPGNKENGSVFCHNNPWIVIGYTKTKQPDKAYELYTLNAPAYIEEQSDIHETEPYVYSQTIAGRDSKHYGAAKNSWLTGTASWSFIAMSQHILGIEPHFDGLKIQPCLPKSLGNVSVKRIFRDKTFNINIIHDEHQKGKIFVNQQLLQGDIINMNQDEDHYDVICYI